MSAAAPKYASFWRRAGLNYLESIAVTGHTLRSVLKEPARSQALRAAAVSYRETIWQNGVQAKIIEEGVAKKK